MKKLSIILALFALVLFFTGCGVSGEESQKTITVTLESGAQIQGALHLNDGLPSLVYVTPFDTNRDDKIDFEGLVAETAYISIKEIHGPVKLTFEKGRIYNEDYGWVCSKITAIECNKAIKL